MFKVGMYGGSFNPLHLGHVNCIIEAASQCEELNIVISYSKKRDEVHEKIRYRWIHILTEHIGNVKIHLIEDRDDRKESYDWKQGAQDIKDSIGKKIDAVFCGSDYLGKNIFEDLYQDSSIVYFDRNNTNISSTMIRNNPYKYWDYIPNVVKPYYNKKVLIIGGESSGKSVLTKNLAYTFNTNYVEEFGRDICDRAGGLVDYMIEEDFLEIMLQHKINEVDALAKSNKILFVDTDVLITKFYFNLLFEKDSKYNKLANSISSFNDFDLILFLNPDVPFVQDGTRTEEIKNDREKYSNQIKEIFNELNIEFIEINGNYLERYNTSKQLVTEIIK